MVTHPFAPVVDENCRTLILGSFPSVKRREGGFFWGAPEERVVGEAGGGVCG